MKIWWIRLLIGVVLFFNIQCALAFILSSQLYTSGFGLQGFPGEVAIRGMGLLFLMWNVPYIFAVYHPIKNRISLYESTIMQMIGVIGETIFLLQTPQNYQAIHETINRFILFDAAGLFLLVISIWMVKNMIRRVTNDGSKFLKI